jgi:hypothetical protein
MVNDTELPFDLPSVSRKKVSAAFDGGVISSDGGMGLLAAADRALGLSDKLAGALTDRRCPSRVQHSYASIIRARVLAIASGYEDGNDFDRLRSDPALKLACGRLPETGLDLCSQPTISRFENAPDRKTLVRLAHALIAQFCESFTAPPASITLDIDDTVDEVHGGQQLSLFNAYEDAHCFKPIHIYDAATGRPVFILLRPGKTPSGVEVRRVLRFVVRAIRQFWPKTAITIRGDSHYARPEAMSWCEDNGVDYVLGLPMNEALRTDLREAADVVATTRAVESLEAVRGFIETQYAARSWSRKRRVIARIEASRQGLDIRTIVTSLTVGEPGALYSDLYCARGQAENLIKLHKTQLKSDRTSCSAAEANQMRLILHTAAYWLMIKMREAIDPGHALARAEFNTLRLRLLKIGARIRETAHRVRIAFAAACPDADLVRKLFTALTAQRPAPAPA